MRFRHLAPLLLLLLLLFAVSCEEVPKGTTPTVTTAAATTVTTATTAPITTAAPLDPQAAGYVKRADGIVIDGVAEEAYYDSVHLSSLYADDTTAISPKDGFPMYDIHVGSALTEMPSTSFTLYALWGEEEEDGTSVPYLYFLITVRDTTPTTRTGAYMAQGDPWLNDAFELSYHLGGATAPTIPEGDRNTYPTYHNVLVDAREKSADDHTAACPNHTAVAAQRSYYFDKIETATTRKDDNTYIIEMKIPAYTESYSGTPGPTLSRTGGDPLASGDLIYLCIELLDLTYLPEGYDDVLPSGDKYANEWSYSPQGDWKAFESNLYPYVYSVGNRSLNALSTNGPIVFQLQ